jgi:hypothetical protein
MSDQAKNPAVQNLKFRQQLAALMNEAVGNGVHVSFIVAQLADAEFNLRADYRDVQRELQSNQAAAGIVKSFTMPKTPPQLQ